MNILSYTLVLTSLLTCKPEVQSKEIKIGDITSKRDTVQMVVASAQNENPISPGDKTDGNIRASAEKNQETRTQEIPKNTIVQTQVQPVQDSAKTLTVPEDNKVKAITPDKVPEDTLVKVSDMKSKAKEEKETMVGLEHSAWNELLKKYVDDEGNVNYKGFQKDIKSLEAYLKTLAENPPASTWNKNEKLAYYINLYNAATVKLIVDHYPTKSIKDIPNRWKKKWITVGNTTTSLNDIEHEVLRKMNEPRIHFAINCASYSCPKLLNIAFTPQNMERLLSKTAVDFVNDTKRNRFQKGKAELSKIFKWYKGDFTKKTSLLEYINLYLDNPIGKKADIDYLDYDWSLNEAK